MNLSKLTFSQCQRLCSPENLARLQTAYACQLRRHSLMHYVFYRRAAIWNYWLQLDAERVSPRIVARWAPIFAAIKQDGAAHQRLAELADLEDTEQTRAYWETRRRAQVQIDRFAFNAPAWNEDRKFLNDFSSDEKVSNAKAKPVSDNAPQYGAGCSPNSPADWDTP